MQHVTVGNSITFRHIFLDNGTPTDPDDDVIFKVVKTATSIVYGPYTYSAGDVVRVGPGEYTFSLNVSTPLVPNIYSARWDATVNGVDVVFLEDFQVAEEDVVHSQSLMSPPRTYGKIRISGRYRYLGDGVTDTVMLVGHANGLTLNSPYMVRDMRTAVNLLQADPDSPLLRGMMEAYNAGCRDIVLVAAAPLNEYVAFEPSDPSERFIARDEWGGLNFYEKYHERLDESYQVLMDYDYVNIIVPLEAPFYNSGNVNFVSQLTYFCEQFYAKTGNVVLGMLGTRIGTNRTDEDVDAMVNSQFISGEILHSHTYDDVEDTGHDVAELPGKFTMIIQGEGIFRFTQMPSSYSGPLNAYAAGVLSTRSYEKGLVHAKMKDVISLIDRDLSKKQVVALAEAGVNPAIRTVAGKRGEPYSVILATDNTLGAIGGKDTDYWALPQIRLVAYTLHSVKAIGNRKIGTIGFDVVQSEINDFLNKMVAKGIIRGYNFDMVRDGTTGNRCLVSIGLFPYSTLREIFFIAEVGPGD